MPPPAPSAYQTRRQSPRLSVVICTLPRSGSWLLCDGLLRSGVAGRPQEYFRPDWLHRFQEVGNLQFQNRLHQGDPWPPAPRTVLPAGRRDIHRFLAQVTAIGTTDNGVFSMKCHWFQADDLLSRLQRSGRYGSDPRLHDIFPAVRYVRLTREDKVRQAISWYRAMQSNVWWADGGGRDTPPPRYNPQRITRLRSWLEDLERHWDTYLARCPVAPIQISYEALADDHQGTIRRVLQELGLWSPMVPVQQPRLGRQADAVTASWAARLTEDTRPGRIHQRAPARAPHGRRQRRGETAMRTSIIIVDNFYANSEAVRDYARKQEFYFPYQSQADVAAGRGRVTWMTSRFKSAADCPFKSSADIIERLEYLTGDRIDLRHWNLGFPLTDQGKPRSDHKGIARSCLWNCSFHVKPETGQELGDGVHNHVVDSWNSVGETGWAGLIYLNADAPLRGGLKLWRNIDPAHNYDWMTPRESWELIDDLGNVPNRLLLCRGNIPHSGARGWGSGLADGRLYQTFFFRILSRAPLDGVLAPV